MGVLSQTFSDRDTALLKIESDITSYYKENYKDYYATNKDLINTSITSVQKGFRQNTFPKMKVTYDLYPEHIGHLESDGCFRCHNDAFVAENGRKISRDCNLCHTIVGQGQQGKMEYTSIRQNLEFQHPVDIGTIWKEANCSECHKYLYQ